MRQKRSESAQEWKMALYKSDHHHQKMSVHERIKQRKYYVTGRLYTGTRTQNYKVFSISISGLQNLILHGSQIREFRDRPIWMLSATTPPSERTNARESVRWGGWGWEVLPHAHNIDRNELRDEYRSSIIKFHHLGRVSHTRFGESFHHRSRAFRSDQSQVTFWREADQKRHRKGQTKNEN